MDKKNQKIPLKKDIAVPRKFGKSARSRSAHDGDTPAPPHSTPKLSPPSQDLAGKILSELGWEQRIEGYRCIPMTGNLKEFIFKFKDATKLLHAHVGDPWSTSSGYFGFFDFDELLTWIRSVFGDEELASAISERIASDSSLKEKIEVAKPLMEQRLRQCEEKCGKGA
jgi:hypothetical protein